MSRDWVADVKAFHQKFGQPVCLSPSFPPHALFKFRVELVREEYKELLTALGFSFGNSNGPHSEACPDGCCVNYNPSKMHMAAAADAIVDLIYVLTGMALTFGIDLRPVWDEVQRANMAKEGGGIRADGKVLKPEGWKPPDIEGALKCGKL